MDIDRFDGAGANDFDAAWLNEVLAEDDLAHNTHLGLLSRNHDGDDDAAAAAAERDDAAAAQLEAVDPDNMNDESFDAAVRAGARSLHDHLGRLQNNPSALTAQQVDGKNEQDFGERRTNESDEEHLARRSLPRKWQREFAEMKKQMLGDVTPWMKPEYDVIVDEFKKWAVNRVHTELADPANEKLLPDALVQGYREFQKLGKDNRQFFDWYHSYHNLDSAGNMIAKFYDTTRLRFDFRQYEPLAKLTDVVTKSAMKWDTRQRPALLFAGPKSSGKTYMMTAIALLWFSGVHSHKVHQTSLAITAGGLHDLQVHSQDEAPPEMIGGGAGTHAADVEQSRGNAAMKAMMTNKLVTSTRLQQVDGKWKQVTYLSSHIGTFIMATNLAVSTSDNPTLARFIVVMVPQISSSDEAAIEKRIAQLQADDIKEIKENWVIDQQLTNWYLTLLELYIFVGIVQEVDMDTFAIQLQQFQRSMDRRGFLLQDPKRVVTLQECTRTLVVELAVTMAMFSEISYSERHNPATQKFWNYFEHPNPLYFINIMEQFLVCTTSICAYAYTMLSVLWSNPAASMVIETVRGVTLGNRLHLFDKKCFSTGLEGTTDEELITNNVVDNPPQLSIDPDSIGLGDTDSDDEARIVTEKFEDEIALDRNDRATLNENAQRRYERVQRIYDEKSKVVGDLDAAAAAKGLEVIDKNNSRHRALAERLGHESESEDASTENDDDDDDDDTTSEPDTTIAVSSKSKRKRNGVADHRDNNRDPESSSHSTSSTGSSSASPVPPAVAISSSSRRSRRREKLQKIIVDDPSLLKREKKSLQHVTYQNDADRITAKAACAAELKAEAAPTTTTTTAAAASNNPTKTAAGSTPIVGQAAMEEAEFRRLFRYFNIPFKVVYRDLQASVIDADYIEIRHGSNHLTMSSASEWIIQHNRSSEKTSIGNIETVLKDLAKSEITCPSLVVDAASKTIVAGKPHTIAIVQIIRNSRQIDPNMALGNGVRIFMSTYHILNNHSIENAMICSLLELGFESSMPLNVITNFTVRSQLYRAPQQQDGKRKQHRVPVWGVFRTVAILPRPGVTRVFVNPKRFTKRMLTLYEQSSRRYAKPMDIDMSLTTCAPSVIVNTMPEYTSVEKHKQRCGVPSEVQMLSNPYLTSVFVYQIRRMLPEVREMETYKYPHHLLAEVKHHYSNINLSKIYNSTQLQSRVATLEDSALSKSTPKRAAVPYVQLVVLFHADFPFHRALRGFLMYSNMPTFGKDARATLDACIERFEEPERLRAHLRMLGVNEATLMLTNDEQQEYERSHSTDMATAAAAASSRMSRRTEELLKYSIMSKRRTLVSSSGDVDSSNNAEEETVHLDTLLTEDSSSRSSTSSTTRRTAAEMAPKLTKTAFDTLTNQLHNVAQHPANLTVSLPHADLPPPPTSRKMNPTIESLSATENKEETERVMDVMGKLHCKDLEDEQQGSREADEARMLKEEQDLQQRAVAKAQAAAAMAMAKNTTTNNQKNETAGQARRNAGVLRREEYDARINTERSEYENLQKFWAMEANTKTLINQQMLAKASQQQQSRSADIEE